MRRKEQRRMKRQWEIIDAPIQGRQCVVENPEQKVFPSDGPASLQQNSPEYQLQTQNFVRLWMEPPSGEKFSSGTKQDQNTQRWACVHTHNHRTISGC